MTMNKGLVLIVAGCVTVLSLTAAAYVELTKFHPEAEMKRMLAAMAKVTGAHYETGLNWSDPTPPEGSVGGSGEGRVTTTVFTQGQGRVSEALGFEHGTRFRVVRYSRTGSSSDLSGEMRGLGGRTYLTYEAPGPQVPGVSFDGTTWLKFEPGELAAWGEILPGIAMPIVGENPMSDTWDPEAVVRLRAFLPRADVVHVQYDGLEEKIHGVDARIIDAWFDHDAVRALLRELVRLHGEREPTSEERVGIETQAAALERLPMRLWIGKEDHRLHRLQFVGAIPSGEAARLIPMDGFIDLSRFDEPLAVAVPSPTLAFRSLVGSALANFFAGDASGLPTAQKPLVTGTTARLPSIRDFGAEDADGDGLSSVLEAFYGTDVGKSDTDGDGFGDGDEVAHGRNPRGDGTLFGFGLEGR